MIRAGLYSRIRPKGRIRGSGGKQSVSGAFSHDVFHLKDGKVVSFHCYVAVPIMLAQLGVLNNLDAAVKGARA